MPARLPTFALVLGLTGCSLLVGDGSYQVGLQDGGHTRDARGDARREAGPADVREEARSGKAAVGVSAGVGFGSWCAVTLDGAVECWGDNFYGDLGDGTTNSSTSPVAVKGLPPGTRVTQVSVGTATACALTMDRDVYCWGNGMYGQLGNGGTSPLLMTPVAVRSLQDVLSISVNAFSACAVKRDGTVWCWGSLGDTLGVAMSTNLEPAQVIGVTGATAVSVGYDTVCAIVSGGKVTCWGGFAGEGTLGNGTLTGSTSPVPVPALGAGVTDISLGELFGCAVAGGEVACWGINQVGQLGQGNADLTNSTVPRKVSMLGGSARSVAAGQLGACALMTDGTVWCWGSADDGELGDGPPTSSLLGNFGYFSGAPVQVRGLAKGEAVALDPAFGVAPCVVTQSGAVKCWGRTCEHYGTPVHVPLPGNGITTGPVGAVSVSIGGEEPNGFACATTSQNTTACWGNNADGQLGNGSTTSTLTPELIKSALLTTQASSVSAGFAFLFACGLGSSATGGTVQCWGDDAAGELGNGMQESSAGTPGDLVFASGTPPQVAQVSAGGLSACVLTSTGGLLCWGDDNYGELGNGTIVTSAVKNPMAVPTLTSGVTAVSVGQDYACAILAGGTVDCWGDNSLGQLGTGSPSTATPTPVPGLSGVTAISAGWTATCAVAGGNVYCWGYGMDCELGNVPSGSTNPVCASSATPVLVQAMGGGPLTGATQVSVGYNSACAIVDGGADCWGTWAIGNVNVSSLYSIGNAVPVTGISSGVTAIAVGHASACAVVSGELQCWGDDTGGQLGIGGVTNHYVATAVPGFP